MSTIGYSNWAVDLANVGPVYPFQGWEWAMVIAAFAFWIIWHIVQIAQENREYAEDQTKGYSKEHANHSIDRY